MDLGCDPDPNRETSKEDWAFETRREGVFLLLFLVYVFATGALWVRIVEADGYSGCEEEGVGSVSAGIAKLSPWQRQVQSSLDAIHFSSEICIVDECGIDTSKGVPSVPSLLCTHSDFQCTLWIQRSSCRLLLSTKWWPLVLKLEVFAESGFRNGDVLAIYLGFNLGYPLFGRVDGRFPKILHVRNVNGWVDNDKDVDADSLKAIRRKLVPAYNLKQSVAKCLLLMIKPVSSKRDEIAADL
ncbi:hypothetical protein L1987_06617 [Smallanthus sonchifolius]|uniref:Uncharacterized protein n=1 Tax=Smallanthus sonchifolius TaxID=185202 RepID=A0ACB9JYM2_9ASTR|nr:hypothetical protein L1987_06617 [Smallanthus sonchifolius]